MCPFRFFFVIHVHLQGHYATHEVTFAILIKLVRKLEYVTCLQSKSRSQCWRERSALKEEKRPPNQWWKSLLTLNHVPNMNEPSCTCWWILHWDTEGIEPARSKPLKSHEVFDLNHSADRVYTIGTEGSHHMWWERSVPIVYTRLVEWLRSQTVWDGGFAPARVRFPPYLKCKIHHQLPRDPCIFILCLWVLQNIWPLRTCICE